LGGSIGLVVAGRQARHLRMTGALVLVVVLGGCGSASRIRATGPTTVPPAASAAAQQWLGHLVAHNGAAAFGDLAPRSQRAVGNVDNYLRASGEFGSAYSGFAPPSGAVGGVFLMRGDIVVVMLRSHGEHPAAVAVPVRRVGAVWRVDPILGVGDYSFQPDEGATVPAQPRVTIRVDANVSGQVWFDDAEAVATSATTFRPRAALPVGWHVVTVALLRSHEVVTRTFDLRVAVP
jgi:hypothetical protein